jgi:hypothetical protein
MKKHTLLLLLVLLVRAAPAWGQTSFAGTWDTTFGRLVLAQQGDKVIGTYYAGRASLKGTVEKKKLTFTYKEEGEQGKGWFELAADGRSFTGKYLADGTENWSPWDGARK